MSRRYYKAKTHLLCRKNGVGHSVRRSGGMGWVRLEFPDGEVKNVHGYRKAVAELETRYGELYATE